jgi:hypothetical protein
LPSDAAGAAREQTRQVHDGSILYRYIQKLHRERSRQRSTMAVEAISKNHPNPQQTHQESMFETFTATESDDF